MQKLTITPPLLNTPCPWCSELDNLRELYACEHTGAVTTRTSMLTPYPHDWAVNQYVLFDSTAQQVAGVNTPNATSQQTSSLNTIGLSPNNLATTLSFIRTISAELTADSHKPFIISVFGSPEEVGELVLSDANPLESRFSPSYSMVLNLLQRFSLDEAKELILKSFGYFSSSTRLSGLQFLLDENKRKIDEASEFKCPYNYSIDDLMTFNKVRDNYIQNKRTLKTMYK